MAAQFSALMFMFHAIRKRGKKGQLSLLSRPPRGPPQLLCIHLIGYKLGHIATCSCRRGWEIKIVPAWKLGPTEVAVKDLWSYHILQCSLFCNLLFSPRINFDTCLFSCILVKCIHFSCCLSTQTYHSGKFLSLSFLIHEVRLVVWGFTLGPQLELQDWEPLLLLLSQAQTAWTGPEHLLCCFFPCSSLPLGTVGATLKC